MFFFLTGKPRKAPGNQHGKRKFEMSELAARQTHVGWQHGDHRRQPFGNTFFARRLVGGNQTCLRNGGNKTNPNWIYHGLSIMIYLVGTLLKPQHHQYRAVYSV